MYCYTNIAIHLLLTVLTRVLELRYEIAYAISVYGSILLLAGTAEIVIRRRFQNPPIGMNVESR